MAGAQGGWLSTRTRRASCSLDDAFDFLGFNVRRQSGKLLIKPSKAAIKRHRQRLRREMRSLRGHNAMTVLQKAQPHRRGMGGLLPHGGLQRAVLGAGPISVDASPYKWAKQSHPKKSKHWIVNRYFGRFNTSRNDDRWVFGDRNSGAYLVKHAWTADRPTPDGQNGGVTRRPRLGRVLGRPAPSSGAPTHGCVLSLRLLQAQRRDLPAVRGASPPCRPPTTKPRGMGAVGPHHRQGAVQVGTSPVEERGTSDDTSTLRLVHTRCLQRHPSTVAPEPSLPRPHAFGFA